MKYFSEKTKRFYEDEKSCVDAEAKFDAEQARIAEEKKVLAETRKARAKEIEDAYKAAREADRHYLELRNAFVKDYGSFHMTVRSQEAPTPIEELFRMFF